MSNLYESDTEHDTPKPKPWEPKPVDVLEAQLWRARAKQNQAELRALKAETSDMIRRARREAAGLRQRLKAANARIAELEGDQ